MPKFTKECIKARNRTTIILQSNNISQQLAGIN